MDSFSLSGLATQQIECSLIAVVVINRHEEFREKNHVFLDFLDFSQQDSSVAGCHHMKPLSWVKGAKMF